MPLASSLGLEGLSSRVQRAGVSERAIKAEISTEMARGILTHLRYPSEFIEKVTRLAESFKIFAIGKLQQHRLTHQDPKLK